MPRTAACLLSESIRDYPHAQHDGIDPLSGKWRLVSSTAKSYRVAIVGMHVYWMGYGDVF